MIIKLIVPMHLESFYQLYKSGCLKLDRNICITFENNNEKGCPDVDATEFMERLPFFEEDNQGIILECEIDKEDFESIHFDISGTVRGKSISLERVTAAPVPLMLKIEDVIKIYPLTENALHYLPGKIGKEFALEKPAFQYLFEKASTRWEEEGRIKGVSALFEMSGLNMPQNLSILDNLLQKANKYKQTYKKPDRQERFLLYALVYERRDPFPKSDVSVLFDLCKILADKEQQANYRDTEFYKKLEALKSEFSHAGIVEVLKYFESEPDYKKVREIASHAEFEQRDYIMAALFTKYKILLRDSKYKPLEMLKEIREIFQIFPEETKVALYLIGAFFSYKRFYKDLYVSKRLRILKESKIETEHIMNLAELPSSPQDMPESKSVPPPETKIPSLDNMEKTLDETEPGKEIEPVPSQETSKEQSPIISKQSDNGTESIKPLQYTIESTDNNIPKADKVTRLSDVSLFNGTQVEGQTEEITKKVKKIQNNPKKATKSKAKAK